ncbi:unnamed protein product [Cuscuta campestris]|uniref:Uncharacterized protein n=1 Tax=Cuscuta campestris TaxID=132261 RepID=A0A484NEP9_9ASTE|nr:unnamed protein product [Cuscuta campestris]
MSSRESVALRSLHTVAATNKIINIPYDVIVLNESQEADGHIYTAYYWRVRWREKSRQNKRQTGIFTRHSPRMGEWFHIFSIVSIHFFLKKSSYRPVQGVY